MLASPAARAAARALNAKGLLLQSADGTQLLAARKRPQRHAFLRSFVIPFPFSLSKNPPCPYALYVSPTF